MKKFVIERQLPGAGNLTPDELKQITQTSNKAVVDLKSPYHWIESFVTGDKIYCIHAAESEEVIREHARIGGFPINSVAEVKAMMDPSTGI
jgi:Protein of unknown function (DUF4242)